jgi:tetratricopeptide (TPR) repeat protein
MSALHAATGHFQDAEADVKQGLSIDPKNIPLMLQSARIEMNRQHADLGLASRQLASLLQVDPKNLDAYVMLSDLYSRQGQVDAAISEMETALKLAPLNKPLRLRLAKLYMSNDPPQWSQFDQILEQAQSNSQLSSDPQWYSLQATGLLKRDQDADAVAKMKQAQSMAPDDLDLERQYIDMLIQAKQYADGVQEIDRVLAAGKRLWWLHELRGEALVKQDQKQQALQEFQTALALVDADGQRDLAADIISTIGSSIDPDTALSVLQPRIGIDSGWRLLSIRLYEMKQDWASALKVAEQVSADPLSTTGQKLAATRAIAENAAQLNEFDKARAAYLSWLDQNPNDVIALNNLACLLNDNLNQPQQALQYSKQAYTLASQGGEKISPLITDTEGWVLVRCGGDGAKAGLAMLEQLVTDHGDFLDARYHLAEAYLQAGNIDAAMTQLSVAQDAIKTQEANHVSVRDQLKKNIDRALTQAKQAAAKAEAKVQ